MTARPLQIEIVFTGDRVTMPELLALAQQAERCQLAGIWMAEAYRDSLVPLAAIAMVTSHVRLGTNVSQWTRSLPNMELAAADLFELSGGRFRLGLGTTTKTWNEDWHGIRYERPLVRMKEYVEALRAMWNAAVDSPVTYEGSVFKVREYLRFNGPQKPPIPIHLAATRPRMAKLAGRIADGVNFNSVLSPRYIAEVMRPAVTEGAAEAGRSTAMIEFGASPITAVSDDEGEALNWNRQQIAFYCGYTTYFEAVMNLHGFGAAFTAIREAFARGDVPKAVSLVTDDMVDSLTIAGTAKQVREKIGRFTSCCDFVMLSPASFLMSREDVMRNQRGMLDAFARGDAAAVG